MVSYFCPVFVAPGVAVLVRRMAEAQAGGAFLRDLRERGLTGVRLVVSDQHLGLVATIGAAHQRRRVHFVRNVFSVIPKQHAEMAAATIRTISPTPRPSAASSTSSPTDSAASSPRSGRCSWKPRTN